MEDMQKHMTDKTNPHNVTPSQVGNTMPIWNANKLKGVEIDNTRRKSGWGLVYNAVTNKMEYFPLTDPKLYDHNKLSNYDPLQHSKLDDNLTSKFTIWSSSKIKSQIDELIKKDSEAENKLSALPKDIVTQESLDNQMWNKANTNHRHKIGNVAGLQEALDSKIDNTTIASTYLKLDGSNDPMTGSLDIAYATTTADTIAKSGMTLQNTDTTVNNAEGITAINGNGMVVGGITFRNVSHSATVGSGMIGFWVANGAAATKVWQIDNAGLLKAMQVGAAATQTSDQRSSNTISFETSNWTGSAEAKNNYTVGSRASTTTNSSNIFEIKYNGNAAFQIVNDSAASTIDRSEFLTELRITASSSSTTPAAGYPASLMIQNSSNTANNYGMLINRNQGNLVTGFLAFKNVSHNASTGSADLEFWLANGAAATLLMTFNAAGNLLIGTATDGMTAAGSLAIAKDLAHRGTKIGFYNTTPIIQPASANQAALTNSTGGSYDGTLVDVTTTAVADPAKVNSNFTDVFTLLDAMRTALVNLGAIKGVA